MRRFLLPRLREFIFIVVFGGALALGSRMLNSDSDLGRHLALGRYMLEAARIPTQDLLSFTRAGEPRPPYEWLAQILLALAYKALRLDGVVILASLAIAAAFAVVFVDCTARGSTPIV